MALSFLSNKQPNQPGKNIFHKIPFHLLSLKTNNALVVFLLLNDGNLFQLTFPLSVHTKEKVRKKLFRKKIRILNEMNIKKKPSLINNFISIFIWFVFVVLFPLSLRYLDAPYGLSPCFLFFTVIACLLCTQI
jgi:hypothetical protein